MQLKISAAGQSDVSRGRSVKSEYGQGDAVMPGNGALMNRAVCAEWWFTPLDEVEAV